MNGIFKLVVMPLYLFSGTFFAVEQLPAVAAPGRLRDAAVARRRPVPHAEPRHRHLAAGRWSTSAYLRRACRGAGYLLARRTYRRHLHA